VTNAQDFRQQEMTNYPSSRGAALVQRAWGMMSPMRWLAYKGQFDGLRSTVSLVSGRNEPTAETQWFKDGSSLVTISDGMVLFVESVCRALASSASWRGKDGALVERALFAPQLVDEVLLDTYRQWPMLLRDNEMNAPQIPLEEQGDALAWGYFTPAMMFIIMHEFGHAALHKDVQHEMQHEIEADEWAIDALLSVFGEQTNQVNICLAGSLVGIRSFAAVDLLVEKFPEGYPPPTERFDAILKRFRSRCADEISYFIDTTIAYAMDMRMESTEMALRGREIRPPNRPEQLVSSMVSALIEAYWNRCSMEEAASSVDAILGASPFDLMAAAARQSRAVFTQDQPTCRRSDPVGDRARIVIESFTELIGRLGQKGNLFLPELQP